MDKEYEFSNWQEVLDRQEEWLQEEISRLKDVANIDDFLPSYRAILNRIENNTEMYTEWDEVGEAFTYSSDDWYTEIDRRIRPIVEKWFSVFCVMAEKSEIDYAEYIENFWNGFQERGK